MSTVRHAPERAPRFVGAEVPLERPADRVRDAVAARCLELEGYRPEALDLASEVIAAFHDHLNGCATAARGHRSAPYRRQQLRGEHPLTIEDLAQLATEPTSEPKDAVAAVLRILGRAIGYRVEPDGRAFPTASRAAAALAEHAGVALGVLLRALEDGQLSAAERAQALPVALQLQQRAADLVAALQAGAR